jgi:hypothetical protein
MTGPAAVAKVVVCDGVGTETVPTSKTLLISIQSETIELGHDFHALLI